jgi:formamidopyrimidine-DNA glycosylase
MPELPEVETFRRQLEPLLLGQRIKTLYVQELGLRMLLPADPLVFNKQIQDKSINNISRRGKFLIFELDQELSILIHLRMSGRLVVSKKELNDKHKRLEIEFHSGSRLNFIDIRRFGTFHLVNKTRLTKLGPDLLNDEYDIEKLFKIIGKRNIALHKLLLDQNFLAGAGNIYANEALYSSGLSPFRSASSLNREELSKLLNNLREIIKIAVNFKGTTLIDKSYKDSLGENGEFSKLLKVYGRNGEKCKLCSKPLIKAKLGGRSVYYCSNCQN